MSKILYRISWLLYTMSTFLRDILSKFRKPGLGEQLILLTIFISYLFLHLHLYVAIALFFITIHFYIRYLQYEKAYWTRLNVPNVPGNVLFGNTYDFRQGFMKFDIENKQKYGNTFGSHVLGAPDMVSFDLDILRQVLLKDADKFEDVIFFDFMKSPAEWKRMRQLIHPKLTSIKLQQFMPIFNRVAEELSKHIEKFAECGNEIPLRETFIKHAFNGFTDAKNYGIEENILEAEESSLMKRFHALFTSEWLYHPYILYQSFFPNVEKFTRSLTSHQMMIQPMREFILRILKRTNNLNDYEPEDVAQNILNTMLKSSPSSSSKNLDLFDQKLTNLDNGIAPFKDVVQFFVSCLSGQDAMAYVMQMLVYILAKMPEIQEKVREEIYDVMGDRDYVEFEDIPKLKYTYQVIQETLRMYPTNPRTNRVCTTPITIKNVPFEPGTVFSVPIISMHYNEDHYPNPQTFNPDRWLPENKSKRDPLTYLPFGYGPHSCIGNKFAEFQMRITLVHLLTKYAFLPWDNSPELPVKLNTLGLVRSYEKLLVIAKKL